MIFTIKRGTLAPIGISILLVLFGFALLTQFFTSLWILGFFGILMLLTALCFTGIEFNIENKTYREYYNLLFMKFGKWQSYDEFKFISAHGVTLSRTESMPNIPLDLGTYYDTTAKIFLLNETHTKKLFITYSKKPEKTKRIIEELVSKLSLPLVKFNPPVSQARLRRKTTT